MPSRASLLAALAATSAAAAAQHAWYWNQLPDRVATHFNFSGTPDDWMSKPAATSLLLATQILIPWFLVGITALTAWLPISLINLPNREYWLAPERRRESLAFINCELAAIALAVAWFMAAVSHLSFEANLSGGPLATDTMLALLGIYMAVVLGIVGRIWWRFRKPRNGRRG
jgi:serine/threonine-protein kinase